MSIGSQKEPDISRILGIDYGASKIGLAIADSETRIASVLGVVKNDKKLLQKLAEIIAGSGIAQIVIGVPSYINKESVKYEGERLGELLEKELKMKVDYQNEMFTTKMAQANLIEKGAKRIKRFDDEEAARIILQDWLDRMNYEV